MFGKDGSDGRLYVFNKRNSDKDTHHIQKVQQCSTDDGKELALVTYSRVATGNNNFGGDENPNESYEHRADLGEGGQEGSRYDRCVQAKLEALTVVK